MNYYFFASTLPAIAPFTTPSMTFGVFHERCAERLQPSDREAMDVIARDDLAAAGEHRHPFLREWHALETQLRNAVARRRAAAAQGPDGSTGAAAPRRHRGFRVEIETGVEAALTLENPLERERALTALRWRLLEELGGFDPFRSAALLAYGCRLRISERWGALTAERGRARFETVAARIAGPPDAGFDQFGKGTKTE